MVVLTGIAAQEHRPLLGEIGLRSVVEPGDHAREFFERAVRLGVGRGLAPPLDRFGFAGRFAAADRDVGDLGDRFALAEVTEAASAQDRTFQRQLRREP